MGPEAIDLVSETIRIYVISVDLITTVSLYGIDWAIEISY